MTFRTVSTAPSEDSFLFCSSVRWEKHNATQWVRMLSEVEREKVTGKFADAAEPS